MTSYVEEDYIETISGVAFHFADPQQDEIRVADIAWSLSNQCRYTGHVRQFYSVAEHCCLLYDFAQSQGITDKKFLRTLLMHDASEAYLTDIARPIKAHIPDYKRLEVKIETAIAERCNLTYPYPADVKELDTRILMDERAQVMGESENVWGVVAEPLGVTLNFWTPKQANRAYVDRYLETISE
jgi:hypothetical protein